MKKTIMLLVVLVLLLSVAAPGLCDFGRAGNMVSPAVLSLIPQNSVTGQAWVASGTYSWSYAPLFFKPDEREGAEASGPAPTDPAARDSAVHLKLPGASNYMLYWEDGWAPDTVSVSVWDVAVYEHPEETEAYFLGTKDPAWDRIVLEPDRIYVFTAEWIRDYPDEEEGRAEYILVTDRMTEEETARARGKGYEPPTEEDLRLLTIKVDGVDIVLGQTTGLDLEKQKIFRDYDYDGSLELSSDMDGAGYVYAMTENEEPDQPIVTVDAFWAYDLPIEYCGFDGMIGDPDTDPDNLWLEEEYRWTAEDLKEMEEEDDWENAGMWGGMINWMASLGHLEESVEGIYSTTVTLSNGQRLSISSHDSPVSITLLPKASFRPVAFTEDDADTENGHYDLRITSLDRVETDSFFFAELYQEDLYPAEGLAILQAGELIRINGRDAEIVSIEYREGDKYEIGISGDEMTEYYMFRPAYGREGLCCASSMEDWVPVTLLTSVRIRLPLPENFTYTTISAGEEIPHSAEEFLELLRNGEAGTWSPYNTSITFENGQVVNILHSGYPTGPDEE